MDATAGAEAGGARPQRNRKSEAKATPPTDNSKNNAQQASAGASADNPDDGDAPSTPLRARSGIQIIVKDTNHSQLAFSLKHTTKMAKVIKAFSEKSGRVGGRFFYDGVRVLDDHTPESLDMEDNDVVEVHEEQIGGGDNPDIPIPLDGTIVISVKHCYTHALTHFKVYPTIKLEKVMEVYARREECSVDTLQFAFDSKTIVGQDTPASLGMRHGDVIQLVVEEDMFTRYDRFDPNLSIGANRYDAWLESLYKNDKDDHGITDDDNGGSGSGSGNGGNIDHQDENGGMEGTEQVHGVDSHIRTAATRQSTLEPEHANPPALAQAQAQAQAQAHAQAPTTTTTPTTTPATTTACSPGETSTTPTTTPPTTTPAGGVRE